MKKKINLQFLIMSVTAIILTLVISTLVSYEVLKDEVMEDLHTYARVLRRVLFQTWIIFPMTQRKTGFA